MRRAVALAAVLSLAACRGGGATPSASAKVASPTSPDEDATTGSREAPPASGTVREAAFPAVIRARLGNGVGLDVVNAPALPLVHVRVLVRAGRADAAPGVADLTATMLKDGGTRSLAANDVLRRLEGLGATLEVDVDADRTVLATVVAKEHLDGALALLGQIVREPRFDEGELKKARARLEDEVAAAFRGNGTLAALRIVFRELYPSGHPYATFGALPQEVAKVDGAAIRAFYNQSYVAPLTTVVLAGDIDDAAAKVLAERHFGGLRGGAPARGNERRAAGPREGAPRPPRVFVAHRPKSAQSDLFVVTVAPERTSPTWPSVRVATQILGGSFAGRLFFDVREKRSLAYRAYAEVIELAAGPQPTLAYAGTETAKTAEAAAALLANVSGMATAPPTAAETESARRYLSDVFAVRMETVGAIADLVVKEDALGLGAGYWDVYRRALRATEPEAAAAAAKQLFGGAPLLVVSGDADAIAPGLSRFGEVVVVDPEKELKTVKTIPMGGARER